MIHLGIPKILDSEWIQKWIQFWQIQNMPAIIISQV